MYEQALMCIQRALVHPTGLAVIKETSIYMVTFNN